MAHSIHKVLYEHCNTLFKLALESGTIEVGETILNMKHDLPLLYLYPNSYNELLDISNSDIRQLRELGWLEPIFGKCFIVWYRPDSTVQLVPFNPVTLQLEKHKPLSNEIPFLYKLVSLHEQPASTLFVLESPLHAILLSDRSSLQCIATGGPTVQESHIKHLATFTQYQIVFICREKNISSAENVCKQMGALGITISVVMVNEWDEILEAEEPQEFFNLEKINAIPFLLNRIGNKKRNKHGLSVTEEIISTSQMLSLNVREKFIDKANELGYQTLQKDVYALACGMLSNLLLADIPLVDGISIVSKRFGVKISLSPS